MKKRFSQAHQDVGEAEALESLMSLDLAVEKELALTVSEIVPPLYTSTYSHNMCIGLCKWYKIFLGLVKPLLI